MSKRLSECPTELLTGFLCDELSSEDSASIELHIESCERCRMELENQSGGKDFWSSVSGLSDDQFDVDWHSYSTTSQYGHEAEERDRYPSENRDIRLRAIFETVRPLLAPSDYPNSAGRIGSYEVLGMVGSGGMGVVVKAKDASLDRVVAIKLLAPHLAAFETSRERFQREAKAAAAVRHDGIISIHSVASHQGIPYFVMPYEAGPSLQMRIQQHGKLTIEESLRVAVQIAGALEAAHQTGLVHRDIKPSNILLAPGTERALLTDFGLAQVCDQQNITQTGLIAGTPMFMSPEQARGETVDSRSDLFSLGSVLFMMLSGQPPVQEETGYAIVRKIGGTKLPSLTFVDPKVPEWIDRLVGRLHELDPVDRIQSAKELRELLAQSLAYVQNPEENSLPMSLVTLEKKGASGAASKSKFTVAVGTALLALIALCTFLLAQDGLAPFFSESRPVESTDSKNNSQRNAEGSMDDWNDQLGPVIEDIRLRIEAIEASDSEFEN